MPKVDFEKQNFTTGHGTFCRETLTKTMLFKGEAGVFAVVSKILDPDTLKIETARSFHREESLRRLIGLYLSHHANPDEQIVI